MSLENASDEVKLAVDLIMLLESHQIGANRAERAGNCPAGLCKQVKKRGKRVAKPREVGCCLRQCAGSLVLCA